MDDYLTQPAPFLVLVALGLGVVALVLQAAFIPMLIGFARYCGSKEGLKQCQAWIRRLNQTAFLFMFALFGGAIYYPRPFHVALVAVYVAAFFFLLRRNTRALETLY